MTSERAHPDHLAWCKAVIIQRPTLSWKLMNSGSHRETIDHAVELERAAQDILAEVEALDATAPNTQVERGT